MSWFSQWFKSVKWKAILDLGVQILKVFLGKVAEDLQKIAKEEVDKAERTGKTGAEKYEIALKALKKRFPDMKESFINHAIETAVLALAAFKEGK
jgi:hypothetical protein